MCNVTLNITQIEVRSQSLCQWCRPAGIGSEARSVTQSTLRIGGLHKTQSRKSKENSNWKHSSVPAWRTISLPIGIEQNRTAPCANRSPFYKLRSSEVHRSQPYSHCRNWNICISWRGRIKTVNFNLKHRQTLKSKQPLAGLLCMQASKRASERASEREVHRVRTV